MTKKSTITLFLIALLFVGCGMRGGGSAEQRTEVAELSASLDGVVINGVRWATRNVDAPGTFAESPESAGMFFQWSRKKGWYATDEIMREGWDIRSSFTSTIWDTEWYAENDPCPEGWRIPTRRELEQLRRANSEWTSKNGVYGRLFGTAPNQIFLPAAKFLTTSGNIGWHLGNHGSYWSRTQDSRNRDSVAWRFTFSESDYLWVNAMHKALGFNIRCVSIN